MGLVEIKTYYKKVVHIGRIFEIELFELPSGKLTANLKLPDGKVINYNQLPFKDVKELINKDIYKYEPTTSIEDDILADGYIIVR